MKNRKRFSKSEMAGFTLLLFVLALSIAGYHYSALLFPSSHPKLSQVSDEEQQEMKRFLQQIEQDSAQRAQSHSYKRNNRINNSCQLFFFDPNTADSSTLSRLGLLEWQINNLLKYRKKGGKWKNPKDFARLYGLDSEDFKRLEPYIRIQKSAQEIAREQEKIKKDSLYQTYPKKYEEGTLLALDQVDTTELKKIPGIGSYYARKICRYRERLGGFLSTEQLKEIEGLPQGIEKWFQLPQNPQVKQLDINHSDFKTLIRHPYLNYEQVKAICNYTRKYGRIKNWEELSNTQLFSEDDIKRLRPYSRFD